MTRFLRYATLAAVITATPLLLLLWREGMAIGDFDGNPLLSSADRGLPGPTAHDVAGV
jgi:hypothetical protein